jgi:hypothetical protein
MQGLTTLVMALAEAAATRRNRPPLARLACMALAAVGATACAAAALVCALVALWLATVTSLGPAGAWLLVAGVLLGLTFATMLAAWLLPRRKRLGRPAATLATQLLAEASKLTRANEGPMLLAALAAGLAAGSRGK